MNGTYKPGGNMNLSGTQGLGLDMEPWAYEARGRNSGLRQGRREGYEEGHSEGHSEGFDDGFWDGLRTGRNQAWNEANSIIENLNMEVNSGRYESNCFCVFVNALRRTVETLIEKNPNSASYIRGLFRENYENEVEDWIKDGMIYAAPHIDPRFSGAPRIKRFVSDIYS